MDKVTLNSGLNWDNLPKTKTRRLVDKDDLLSKIDKLRQQWTEATGGDMSNVTLNLDLLLDDIEAICKGE